MTPPKLWRIIEVPEAFCTSEIVENRTIFFGGDIRIGDLRNNGQPDFLVYRSVDQGSEDGALKPCFLGAFNLNGEPLWSIGEGGTQPSRPGPVALYDLDGDGNTEIICFFHKKQSDAPAASMSDVVIQIRDGATGNIKKETAPELFQLCNGQGPNWVHQRILIANFRGLSSPKDFVVKLGAKVLAFDDNLNILWKYESPWTDYGHCPAYIPAVGDIDGDGKDEVNGGYFLIDHDGTVLWQKDLAPHMDSVAIVPWDNGCVRAICSGHGHILDEQGNVIMALGPEMVPHGQEVRVGRFRADDEDPQMIIRRKGHSTELLVVDVNGKTLAEPNINQSPNNTGMEVVYWDGKNAPALLYNGGMLWNPLANIGIHFPELPPQEPVGRMAWYHCIPADICGDEREEIILYNPWSTRIYIYTQQDNDGTVLTNFKAEPRQYNPRLMD